MACTTYVFIGSEYRPANGHTLDIGDFSDLAHGEALFAHYPDAGDDGDYVFKLSPDMMLDLDMRRRPVTIDTRHGVCLFKARKFGFVGWRAYSMHDASEWDSLISSPDRGISGRVCGGMPPMGKGGA